MTTKATPRTPRLEIAALTIAGSDSCGGAGIQADLNTFQAMGVYGASVITALTAQNTVAVSRAEAVSPEMIADQLEAVLDDLPIRAIKTGMLPNAAVIGTVSAILERRCKGVPLIVDPVLVATSGASLTLENTIEAMKTRLIPLADLVTPNLSEAETLCSAPTADDPQRAAEPLLALGCRAVLLKGGHGGGDTITDWLVTADSAKPFEHAAADGAYHGTGCVLASAIAAGMAAGNTLEDAVEAGIAYVQTAIANARRPLRGKLRLIT